MGRGAGRCDVVVDCRPRRPSHDANSSSCEDQGAVGSSESRPVRSRVARVGAHDAVRWPAPVSEESVRRCSLLHPMSQPTRLQEVHQAAGSPRRRASVRIVTPRLAYATITAITRVADFARNWRTGFRPASSTAQLLRRSSPDKNRGGQAALRSTGSTPKRWKRFVDRCSRIVDQVDVWRTHEHQ